MTKKTIMQLLTEADEKDDIKGHYYMDQLFSHAMDDAHELHFESIKQCVAVRSLDALERIANALEKDSTDQTLTYQEFCKEFNAHARSYHAEPSNRGGAVIVDAQGNSRASLDPKSRDWCFNASAFSFDELMLMTKLVNTLPKLRDC